MILFEASEFRVSRGDKGNAGIWLSVVTLLLNPGQRDKLQKGRERPWSLTVQRMEEIPRPLEDTVLLPSPMAPGRTFCPAQLTCVPTAAPDQKEKPCLALQTSQRTAGLQARVRLGQAVLASQYKQQRIQGHNPLLADVTSHRCVTSPLPHVTSQQSVHP